MDWKLWQGSDQEWDERVSAFPYAQFAQSSAWKTFQESLGRQVIRVSNGDAYCQLALIKKTMGYYWLAQRGPVGESSGNFVTQIAALLPRSAWCIRFEPATPIHAPRDPLPGRH